MSEGAAAVAPAPATPSGAAATGQAPPNDTNNGNTNENAASNEDEKMDDADLANAASSSPAVGSTALSTPQKERHSLTLDQRRALRRWANAQLSRPSHKQCIEWFQRQYHQTISQSTVSHSLSPKYARLDGEPQLSGSRLRFGNWPEVEKLVLLWYQQMAHAGRHPTNEELAEKAKSIFSQLPRHRGEEPPEFSPGWIHRFKKRYGLLIRRQRRSSGGAVGGIGGPSDDAANDVASLANTLPQLMSVTADTNPVTIRETFMRLLNVEPSIAVCTRVRDEVVRNEQQDLSRQLGAAPGTPTHGAAAGVGAPPVGGHLGLSSATTESQANAATAAAAAVAAAAAMAVAGSGVNASPARAHSNDAQQHARSNGNGGTAGDAAASSVYHPHPDEDPELVLQNALRQLQQEEADAVEAEAAAAADVAGDRSALAPLANAASGKASTGDVSSSGGPGTTGSASSTAANRPVRCPFCVNQRMLRTIKEAVDHMSTHVVV